MDSQTDIHIYKALLDDSRADYSALKDAYLSLENKLATTTAALSREQGDNHRLRALVKDKQSRIDDLHDTLEKILK